MNSIKKVVSTSNSRLKNKNPTKKFIQISSAIENSMINDCNLHIGPNITSTSSTGYFGNVDAIDKFGAHGWVADASRPSKSVKITASINGIVVGVTTTKNFRPDISEIIQTDAKFGFNLSWDNVAIRNAISGYDDEQICSIKFIPDDETRQLAIAFQPTVADIRTWLCESHIDGHFDQIDSNLIASGWAINSDSSHPTIVEIIVDGAIVAKKAANLPRPDLISSNPENIMSGFKIAIPKEKITGLRNKIDARVNGVSLKGSPIDLIQEHHTHIGVLSIKNGVILAEIESNIEQNSLLEGSLFVDGVYTCTLPIKNVNKKNKLTNKFLAQGKLPENLIDGQPHVYVFSIGIGENIARSDTTVLSYPQYSFAIDHADSDKISGWIFRHDKTSKMQLCLRSNSYPEIYTSTNILRPDVHNLHKNTSENTGFEFFLLGKQVPQGEVFEIYDVETGIVIAQILIFTPYASLNSLAHNLSKISATTFAQRHILSQTLMRSDGMANFLVKSLPPTPPTASDQQVDIIIPIYGGSGETVECLESVLSSKNNISARIIVINDHTPDHDIRNYLALLEKRKRDNLIIFHRVENGGFSEAVNIGMIAAGERDVILLNADTVVQSGWIDRIIGASKIDSKIGTVTPFSNNAEICTLPYICKSLPVLDSDLATEIDNVASSVNEGRIVDLPVAIGFCMYIRRECINEVGYFDAATWGRGYGEEVDFCLKASALGWRHVLTGDTFVVHRGNVSFGDEKLERVKISAKKISERYPFYDQVIQRFLAMDPASSLRRAINLKLISKSLPSHRILHVIHNFGGGTEQYLKDVLILNRDAGLTPFTLRFSSTGDAQLEVELKDTRLAGLFADHHEEKYTRIETKTIMEDIKQLGIEKLHIHSPFGISIEFIDFIKTNYSFDITVHDYSWICPRVSLTQLNGLHCYEPEVKKCSECINFYKPHQGLLHFVADAKENVAVYRDFFGNLFSRAENVFVGAQDVMKRMQRHGIEGKYIPVAHPVTEGSVFAESHDLGTKWDGGGIKVAMFGGISDIKGFHVLLGCAEHALRRNLPIQFILFGHTMNDDLCRSHINIKILGKYEEDSLSELVKTYRPHLSFFPNQGPETFSYTLSHSFRLGIWPVVSDIGAPAERVRESGFGSVYPLTKNVAEICDFIIEQAILQSRTAQLETPQ